jgi:NAD(P)-dependent dehydrogenase (short-subunit alcohol dehydrogenase family)
MLLRCSLASRCFSTSTPLVRKLRSYTKTLSSATSTMTPVSKYAAAHLKPKGPGDSRPTGLDIVKDEGLEGKLDGKVIFITGSSSGIGIDTAHALATTGATLYVTARDTSKGEQVLSDILQTGRVHLLKLDLDSLASVRACAREFLEKSQTLNILINNAGVMHTPEGQTADGFETQFGTNHLAHFLLFNLLKPTLLASATPSFHSRVVALSSSGHQASGIHFDNLGLGKGAYTPQVAYGQSKTANIYMANEIERRYGGQGLHGLSVHPGGIATGLQKHWSEKQKAILTDEKVVPLMKSTAQGAATTVWAAIGEELEGKGGMYLEDCGVSPLGKYAAWAYDAEKEGRLWKVSLEMVGLEDE